MAISAIPAKFHAQILRGTLLDESNRPVEGAIIALRRSGHDVATFLTLGNGRFFFRHSGGEFELRVDRIGMRSAVFEDLRLDPNSTVDTVLKMKAQPVELPVIAAEAESRCETLAGESGVAGVLWAEVRKAFRLTEVIPGNGYTMQIRRYRRRLDPLSLRVLRDSGDTRLESWHGSPFASADPTFLLQTGFIQDSGAGKLYYSPDARLMAADAFARDYCFSVERDTGNGLLGLHFRPASSVGPPGIKGVLWIDALTLQLRTMEYGYTRTGMPALPREQLGGTIHYSRLPGGSWIVSRWLIRMPELRQTSIPLGAPGRTELRVERVVEDGGEVQTIIDGTGNAITTPGPPSLVGKVEDAVVNAPLQGARVYILGTDFSAETDSRGIYQFDRVPDGRYTLTISHPVFVPYRLAPMAREVVINAGVQRREDWLIAELGANSPCQQHDFANGAGILTIALQTDVEPLPDSMRLQWSDRRTLHETNLVVRWPGDRMVTLCGVPVETDIEVDFQYGSRHAPATPLGSIPATRVLLFNATDAAVRGQTFTLGIISKLEGSGGPLAAARISVADGFPLTSDERGFVRTQVAGGNVSVVVEHLAVGTYSDTVAVHRSRFVELVIKPRPLALDTLRAEAKSGASAAKEPSSRYLTRSDIQLLEKRARHVGDLLARFNMLAVREIRPARAGGVTTGLCIESRRGNLSLRGGGCQNVLVVIDGIPLPQADSGNWQGEILLSLPPASIESIEYIPAAIAGARYGTGSAAGALLIETRKGGTLKRRRVRARPRALPPPAQP